MRLDKWLKVSRLIKRRTVANEACDNERISANGRVVKASYEVKVGDQLEIRFGARTVRLGGLSGTEPIRFLFLPAPKTPPWNMAPGRGYLVGGDY